MVSNRYVRAGFVGDGAAPTNIHCLYCNLRCKKGSRVHHRNVWQNDRAIWVVIHDSCLRVMARGVEEEMVRLYTDATLIRDRIIAITSESIPHGKEVHD